ncbi:MAG: energy-coupling factor transporter ATPase [Clostridiales bacterium]|jgi:energy-coupling factor transport system ATP-binding protein|nr:energy-coupling factor transporter ATPase [Clostridiales bacterium]
MDMIELKNVSFTYQYSDDWVLNDLSIKIEEGSFVALCGRNGSGKSTIARLLNGLLLPDKGSVMVDNMNTLDRTKLFSIRKTVGLVFQNPDNQTVATIVEDDVAFGPENIGVPREEIRKRVDWALEVVGMSEYKKSTHTRLSGGQKQRVAIASILALKPRVLVLDESTSMLDPKGRMEVLQVLKDINIQQHITVIMITHFMEEAQIADRIVVLEKGRLFLDGGVELFEQREKLMQAGLSLPAFAEIAALLNIKNVKTEARLVEELVNLTKSSAKDCTGQKNKLGIQTKTDDSHSNVAIHVGNLSFTYSKKTSFAKLALDNVSLQVNEGDFLGIVGHTGSGKTTMIGHINALIKLQSGELRVLDIDLNKKFKYNDLRSKVGMVFQYPEYQLFDETVQKDIAFGPRNLKLEQQEIDERVRQAIKMVGLSFDEIAEKSPFELSGGQKKRVALAGVIAMRPKIIVLDEPTAGLDPCGKKEILDLIFKIKEHCNTVIMISHNMDEVAKYCNKVALFSQGKLLQFCTPHELFVQQQLLVDLSLDIPAATRITNKLNEKGLNLPHDTVQLDELIDRLALFLR